MTLKYYRDENIRCWRFGGKTFTPAETVVMVDKLTDLMGLPRIKTEFTIRSSAGHDGMYRWHFVWETHKLAFKNKSTSLMLIMHEVAHYWDYFNRMREIKQRFGVAYADRRKTSEDNQKLIQIIKKKHAHGKAHKQYMDLLCAIVQKNFPDYVTQGPEDEAVSLCKSKFKECKPANHAELLSFMSTFINANSSLISEVAQHA